jgi:hypothetical protein
MDGFQAWRVASKIVPILGEGSEAHSSALGGLPKQFNVSHNAAGPPGTVMHRLMIVLAESLRTTRKTYTSSR